MDEKELIKKGIEITEREIIEIYDNPRSLYIGKLTDLLCTYRELTCYIKNDSAYELKRWLCGLLLIETIERRNKQNGQRQTRRCFGL